MRTPVRLGSALILVAGLATTSHAALIAGGIPGGAPLSNQFIGPLGAANPIGGWYGAQLYLTSASDVQVDWYGGEATYLNQFLWAGVLPSPLFTHPGGNNIDAFPASPIGSATIPAVSPGLVPFSFFVPTGSLTVANGSNPDNTGSGPNFFVSFDITSSTPGGGGGSVVWLFFDDGGFSNDDDFDDMAIRLEALDGGDFTVVPEPGSMLLLGSGLGALWMRRRRR